MSALNEPTIATDELRPTRIEVDLDVLAENYGAIAAHVAPARVMPILKANAYGHGLVEVGRVVERLRAPYIGVAYLEEGLRLRQHGVRLPVLVLGGILGSQIPRFLEHDITLTASSVDKLRAIEEHAVRVGRTATVHLKIDTGMERIGVHWYSAETLLEESLRCRHLRVEGILFYGARPAAEVPAVIPVRQALSWVTRVVFFKVVKAGHPVSYGGEWVAPAQTRVVTLPVGYGDGYARAMSGRAEVIVHGKRYPVVGRICMDQIMVSIGGDSAYNSDEVVLLGRHGAAMISIEEMAGWAGTIPHEVLTSINPRVPRVYRGGTS